MTGTGDGHFSRLSAFGVCGAIVLIKCYLTDMNQNHWSLFKSICLSGFSNQPRVRKSINDTKKKHPSSLENQVVNDYQMPREV